ncbi:MAG: hypothetical protein AB1810_00870 [Pseudomonadota bacterium]
MKAIHIHQRGAALLVSLVMLLLITMITVSSFNTGKGSLEVVGNMQQRSEGIEIAQGVLETVVSTTAFFETPNNAVVSPCGGTPNTVCVDFNGDGTSDKTVTLVPAPACIKAQPLLNTELNMDDPEDSNCTEGTDGEVTEGGSQINSRCADSVWELNAIATSTSATTALASVTYGAAVRVSTDDVAASCP